ncbi:MAG: PAS domain S-box protein [Rhodocyclaceae bacterium]|nr:MAG: PAS domain S-box protein [Rhodocyclaceae bacterium]
MNALSTPPTPREFDMTWSHCPWGMATIDVAGNLRDFNPALERCTGMSGATLVGMSEAAFVAHLAVLPLEHTRVETGGSSLRAIHYLRSATALTRQNQWLAGLAEILREPLTSIYGFAELLLTQNYADDIRHDLTATLLEQVELMTNLINEQLDTSRPPAAWSQGSSQPRQRNPGDHE